MENYFNYFTEIEECFRRCRKTPTLLSTLDWALIESWKEAGIPLEAVLTGVARAFDKSHRRPRVGRQVNSLAYCTQEVFRAAEEAQARSSESRGDPATRDRPGLDGKEVLEYFGRNRRALEDAARIAQENGQEVLASDLASAAQTLEEISRAATRLGDPAPTVGAGLVPALPSTGDGPSLEELERLLSALEDQLTGSLLRASSVELLAQFRREVESGLAPYRRKMTAVQIESLERQFLKKRLFEHYRIPRMSLFYFG